MTERLLQFIWQFQYFNKTSLSTTSGDPVSVIFPGNFNLNQGPDFIGAKLMVKDTTWAGSVELHLKSSDWQRHGHQHDTNYNNVILHVVWEDDAAQGDILTAQPNSPVLELKSRVPGVLLDRYEKLVQSLSFIPCENSLPVLSDLAWNAWKDRLLAERLSRKSNQIAQYLLLNNYHWDETCWWLLARNFGMKVNADAFEAIARSLSLTVLARNRQECYQLESLLLGQGGMFRRKFKEAYPALLQKEYRFQQKKYHLQPVTVPLHFLRMRPVNFPTVRLAQLASLVHRSTHLFNTVKEASSLKEIKDLFRVTASGYWDEHYRFEEKGPFAPKTVGESMINNIIINTVTPMLFSYGEYHHEQRFCDIAMQWLMETAAEQNAITRRFIETGVSITSAYDSQAMIELKNEYCDQKKCLECHVGNTLIGRMS